MHLLAFEFPDFDKYVLGLQWHGFGVRWYALAYVAGILIGWWYAIRLAHIPNPKDPLEAQSNTRARSIALWGGRSPVMSRDQIDDLILWITVGVIVGGRVGSMLFYNTSALWRTPLEIFKIWQGGMSFHGGLLGVMVAMLLFARFQRQPAWGVGEQQQPVINFSALRMPVLRVSDLVAPCVPIGLFFGRIANFINGELWGRETNLPWGFYINEEAVLPVHPSQLYEALLEGVVLFVILRLATHKWDQLKRPGAVTGIFLAGYAIFRIVVEFVRAPDQGLEQLPLGLTMGMILSIPMLIAGVYLYVKASEESMVVSAPEPAKKAPEAKPAARAKAKAQSTAKPKPKPKAK